MARRGFGFRLSVRQGVTGFAPAPVWILTSGAWDDSKAWDDTQLWKDS